jgi:peptide/histidine transporter 3/4
MKFQHLKEWVEFWKASVEPQGRDHYEEEWVTNGSVDVRGRPVLRTKSSGWKASIFIMGESLSYKYYYLRYTHNPSLTGTLYLITVFKCIFTVVQFNEGLTYFYLSSNLIIYLTTVLHEGVASSVKNINYWAGVTAAISVTGSFIADAYCGRYWMVLMSSIIYLLVSLKASKFNLRLLLVVFIMQSIWC